jgi:hypothetical protein
MLSDWRLPSLFLARPRGTSCSFTCPKGTQFTHPSRTQGKPAVYRLRTVVLRRQTSQTIYALLALRLTSDGATRRWRSNLGSSERHLNAAFDDSGGNRVAGETGRVVDVECLHEVGAMLFDGLD